MKTKICDKDERPFAEFSAPTSNSLNSLGARPFGFDAKTSHDAYEDLFQTRSKHLKFLPDIKNEDIWKRLPPDFRYLNYDPKPPKRNTVDSMRPWEYGTFPGQSEITNTYIPRHSEPLPHIATHTRREPSMITRFHIDRPFTAKKKFVSQGMFKPGTYVNPKPHDFRQYPTLESLGLDEFVTDYEKDAFDLKFKSQRLNHIHGLHGTPIERNLKKARQMAPPLPRKDTWEARLILEKDVWPPRSAAFTRHRRRHRQPYSAFMERVEEDLTARWSREQLEKSLQSCL